MEERNPLGEIFNAFWEPLSPLQRALFLRGITSMFRGVQTPPRPVYHYTSAEAFENIVKNREIWATNAAYLNDSGELFYPVRVAKAVLRELSLAETDSRIQQFIDGVAHDVEEHAVYKAWYITSFSTRGNLLSQWRAYCPLGGYSIGFEPTSFTQVLKQSGLLFGPVIYKQSIQEAAIRQVIINHMKNCLRDSLSRS